MTTAQITKDTKLRELLERWPETAEVLARVFGEGCFICPGAMIETIEFAATMHNLSLDELLEELSRVITTS